MSAAGPGADLERARLLAARGSLAEARAAVEAVLGERPDDAGALLVKGGLLLEERRGEDAVAVYRRAVAAAPDSAEAWNGLARSLHAVGRDRQALDAGMRARELLPEGDNFRHSAPVYLTLVWILRELRRFREALERAEEGLARTPDAVLAQWASVVEEELALAERDEC